MPNLPDLLRKAIVTLVVGLPLLIVVYAVVMGGAALLVTLGDANGALALRWVGTLLSVLLVAGLVVLVLLLGWDRLTRDEVDLE